MTLPHDTQQPNQTVVKVESGISVREVYEMFDRFRKDQEARDEKNWGKIDAIVKDMRVANSDSYRVHAEQISELRQEIFGEGSDKGLRGRVENVEGKTNLFAGLQATLTIVGTAVATWLGTR